jgi:16S rRNA G966 N2-methylase RsmD
VYRNDADRALKALIKREVSFDYIFLDPPYKQQQLVNIMQKMDQYMLVHSGSRIVCEHSHEVELPASIGELMQVKHEEYGIIAITIYEKVTKG